MDEERSKDSNMADDVKYPMLANTFNSDNDNTENVIDTSANKVVIFRNLLVVSFAFMFLFSAFNSFVYLQSSLNKEDGLGTTGVALLYIGMVLSGLFITPLTLSRFSDKKVIVVSMVTYVIYVTTGFYPAWSTVVPASLIVGIGAAHLWLAVQTYITDIAKQYATITHTKVQDRLHFFLGIFYAITYTSNIWGNLFSSLAFQRGSFNMTDQNTQKLCGHDYCPFKETNDTIIEPPPKRQIYIFTGFCAGIVTLALLLTSLFATDISSGGHTNHSVLKKLRQVTVLIFTSRNQGLLIFATLVGGLANGFTAGDFTSAYISCPYGIENVGFVMITYGVSQSVFSVLFGRLAQYLGHIPIYMLGFVTQLTACITLLLWSPRRSEYAVVYVISALFGVGAAVNTPIVSALYNLYFDRDREVAVSSFRVLNSIGWAIAFGYSSWLCTQHKIYVLICVLTLALVTVVLLHILHMKEKQKMKYVSKQNT